MSTSIAKLFQRASHLIDADADAADSVKRRLASAPPPQLERLIANDDLRGFLKAAFRLHADGRIAQADWPGIAHFLMRMRPNAPQPVLHLAKAWPRATESWDTVRDLLRPPRAGAGEPASRTLAGLEALLVHLKQHAQKQSWLSHGFDVELRKMADDQVAIASRRIEVLQLAEKSIGPMNGEQLRDCRRRIAAVLALLPPQAYPCIHDTLSRVSNEANWQLALFGVPRLEAVVLPTAPHKLSAEACP